jgi:hypothetical protein
MRAPLVFFFKDNPSSLNIFVIKVRFFNKKKNLSICTCVVMRAHTQYFPFHPSLSPIN